MYDIPKKLEVLARYPVQSIVIRVAFDRLINNTYRLLIDIDLVERNTCFSGIFREFLEDRGDLAARRTPRCPKVDNRGVFAVDLEQHE